MKEFEPCNNKLVRLTRRYDIQHNDTQHNDVQDNDTQPKGLNLGHSA